MNLPDIMVCIFFTVLLMTTAALIVGHSLIDDIFKQKMELINHMTEKGDV